MRALILFLSCLTLQSCTAQKQTEKAHIIPVSNDSIRVTGRVAEGSDSIRIFWQGTSILFRFRGTSATALLHDQDGQNYFNIVLDGDSLRYIRLHKGKRSYVLAKGLPEGEHTIEIIKRNEWDKGKTTFYGLQLYGGRLLNLPPKKIRSIEFFGNSITSGYANEDYSGNDSPDSTLTNNYYSYAAITARHFNADYYCTSKSGIGIMLSWFDLTMPELYDRLDPSDSTSRWNFKKHQPGVVVINLFQNDAWLVRKTDHQSFRKKFGTTPPTSEFIIKSYKDFLARVRTVYPHAEIICALGPMDITREGSPWPVFVRKAVEETRDGHTHCYFFPYTSKSGHPKVSEHKKMADQLIAFIEEKVKW
jgi:hypothetical protein